MIDPHHHNKIHLNNTTYAVMSPLSPHPQITVCHTTGVLLHVFTCVVEQRKCRFGQPQFDTGCPDRAVGC